MAMLYSLLQQVLTLYGIEMVVAYHISSHEVKVGTAAEICRCDLMSTTKQYEKSSNQYNHVLPNS